MAQISPLDWPTGRSHQGLIGVNQGHAVMAPWRFALLRQLGTCIAVGLEGLFCSRSASESSQIANATRPRPEFPPLEKLSDVQLDR
jgi:hypothetical protein